MKIPTAAILSFAVCIAVLAIAAPHLEEQMQIDLERAEEFCQGGFCDFEAPPPMHWENLLLLMGITGAAATVITLIVGMEPDHHPRTPKGGDL
ncbi:MAG: hypothetical protein WC683_15070 [bacterium]